MNKCEATQENLRAASFEKCPDCGKHWVSHLTFEQLLKKTEKAADTDVKIAEIDLKKAEILADVKKAEITLELARLNVGVSSTNFTPSVTLPNEAEKYTQICRDAISKGASLVRLTELSKYGCRAITIETSDATVENDVCSQFAFAIENALGDPVFYPVNSSEASKWLPDSARNKYKPDLLICSTACTVAKPLTVLSKGHRSAIPTEPKFVKFILEAKDVPLKESEIGKLIFYLFLMNAFHVKSCGLLFNSSDFIYMECTAGVVSCFECGLLADPGALDYIVDKIRSVDIPSIRVFDNALEKVVESIPLEPITMTSLLGFGRYGRVHYCVDKDGIKCAVKFIEIGEDIRVQAVQKEFAKLTAVYSVAPHLTLKPRGDLMLFRDEVSEVKLCAYVIEGVGTQISRSSSKSVCEALYSLHNVGITHGDPRFENIIALGPELRWIDFRGDIDFTREGIISDIKQFLRSAFNKFDSRIFEDAYETFTDEVEKYAGLMLSRSDETVESAGISRARKDPASELLISVCIKFKSRLSAA